jgi:putative tryptophan/tyrosine transport system substrate-binding protein
MRIATRSLKQSSASIARHSVLCAALCAMLFALCTTAEAQQRNNTPKIGWLSALTSRNAGQQEIIRFLRDFGYVDGTNIKFEFRYAANKLDRLPALAEDLVNQKVDLLITPGTPSALALRAATKTIPIIFLDVTDPVAAGLVDSLARPGGNITGFTSIESILAGKRLELLKETISKLSRVAVLWDPQNPGAQEEWKETQSGARNLALQLYSMEVSSLEDYPKAFALAVKAHSGALAVLSTPLTNSNQDRIAELAAKHRLPSIHNRKEFVAQGGLMSYGLDQTERYTRVAVLIDKILKGAKPAELPVERPTKFELVINLKTAKQIGLNIPPNVLARADKVIK